jgi:hypothetical protein
VTARLGFLGLTGRSEFGRVGATVALYLNVFVGVVQVHLCYDRMASFLGSYGSLEALKVAR